MYIDGTLDHEGGNANWVTAALDTTLYLDDEAVMLKATGFRDNSTTLAFGTVR